MPKKTQKNKNPEALTCTLEESAELKARLLERALLLVGRQGWSDAVLEQAAKEWDQPSEIVWALFPEGCMNAIACWSRQLDQQMVERLKALPLADMKVRERIFWAVRTRLELLAPFKAAANQTMRFFLDPRHASQGLCLTNATVHAMWVAAGDTSTDYNYYTKRLLLSGVYGTTFVYWLKDTSLQSAGTWVFLERRIDQVLSIGKIKMELKTQTSRARSFIKAWVQILRKP